MNRDIKFSVIIPTFNRVEFILLAIRSVLNQTYKNFELIVVNDGSTDETESVVATVKDHRLKYIRIENGERGKARNTGVLNATGDYVTFLDSDDQLYDDYLEEALNGIKKYNFIPFYHQAYEIRSYIKFGDRLVHNYHNKDVRFLVKGNPLSCLGVFIRRAEALQFPFNEDRELSGSEDWELWLRLSANFGLRRGKKICACLILHDDRSVYQIEENRLVKRKQLAIDYSFKDAAVVKMYGSYRKEILAHSDTYNSLHLALAGKKKRSLFYLWRAFKRYPPCIYNRRTLAIFKYYLIYLLK
ncbi:MAG: glycosyltransferase family 2 protein [Bacteroidota bacterium]